MARLIGSARRFTRISIAGWLVVSGVLFTSVAHAAVAMLQPPREVLFSEPLRITLLYSADGGQPLALTLPATLRVTVSDSDHAPQPVDLTREPDVPAALRLDAGQYRKVEYSAPWPAWARGEVRIDPVGFDASPAIVAIDRSPRAAPIAQAAQPDAAAAPAQIAQPVAAAAAPTHAAATSASSEAATARAATSTSSDAITAQAANPASSKGTPAQLSSTSASPEAAHTVPATESRAATAALPASDTTPVWTPPGDSLSTAANGSPSRISYFEPMYFAVGHNGDTNARLQVSFKYRLWMPDDLRSKSFLDNLYFGYTQTSIWDLAAESRPFRDTSYQPQLFYYVPDTGWRAPWFARMGIAAGIGHESNGKGGADSRSLNLLFVRPTWEFGDLDAAHWVVSPKIYVYAGKSNNPDIADYRGYADLLIKYGSPDGLQLATTLRKGTKHWYGSVDAQLTYPLAKLLGTSSVGGYVWLGYFNGYGEDLLDYNVRQHWIARIGYSIAR
ncbi:phospholipase A [Paraburkholderia solisilvae]|uniref:phospholipase A n=1 Tax=Paraburkholderia solisilvae TaxID=624376 RepID=UPI001FE30460|nr:phospholipase A [Paraburkholderia solisilvae]